jgi:methionyl-tRNA formyltransferase
MPAKVMFIGSKALGLQIARLMYSLAPASLSSIVTVDDSNDRRTEYAAFQSLSVEIQRPILIAKTRAHADALIMEHRPDLCIVCGWYWLFGESILKSVPRGFIGLHNSLLPECRGGSPLVWSIILGKKRIGCSLFSLACGLDDGPVWAQESIALEETDYIAEALKKVDDIALNMFCRAYPLLLAGTLASSEQDHSRATYCALRLPRDGKINWDRPAADVYNFIRAQSHPYPGAFTYYESQRLTIWRARLYDRPYAGTPGQVARVAPDGVYVICGDNRALILDEVSLLNGACEEAAVCIKSIKGRLASRYELSDANI